ncbi:MAG: flagellin lysine-N-methylase [Massiliimalia sp.]|jgi:lysine-N-methylase
MLVKRPAYYAQFQCLGSQCKDNCCIGWEIDIDQKTNDFYQALPGPFGDRLRASISSPKDGFFLLQQERCPFLNQNNLCDIILTLGESHLCQICTDHPRFYEWFGDYKEAGISLCCEGAGKLMFQSQEPIQFEVVSEEEPSEPFSGNAELFHQLLQTRESIFSLLQNRKLSIAHRLLLLSVMADQLQDALEDEDYASLPLIAEQFSDPDRSVALLERIRKIPTESMDQQQIFSQILSVYRQLEPLSDQWSSMLVKLEKNLSVLTEHIPAFLNKAAREYEYEHMAVYWIYRYFMKSCFDRDMISKVNFAVVSYLVILLLDIQVWMDTGHFSLEDRIFTAKEYSKQIEYSTDNLEALADAAWENQAFQTAALRQVLCE